MLSLLTFPHPDLKKSASRIDPCDQENISLIDNLTKAMDDLETLGLNAPMFGISKCIVVLDPLKIQQRSGVLESQEIPPVLLNPQVIEFFPEQQTVEEANPCFPGIKALITRPAKMILSYQDTEGNDHQLQAQGFLATVIQHQLDHLEGRCFLDHLSPLKRELLMKKMSVFKKNPATAHVHGPHCQHG